MSDMKTPDNLPQPEPDARMVPPYSASSRGITWYKVEKDDTISKVQLSNFDARIIREILHDDGVEVRRVFDIQVDVRGRRLTVQVPATRFGSMTWAMEQIGADTLISPGFVIRDHLRSAIQKLSGDITKHTVYQHTGWRHTDEHGWIYLHRDGGISANGPIDNIAVGLDGALSQVALPLPSSESEHSTALLACLRLDELVPKRISIPIRSAIARVVLGATDFSIFLSGPSGAGKTEYAALAQQHFGAGFEAGELPGSWSSTENALEGLAFLAKDALLVIDDFVPTGSEYQNRQLNAKAERIFRSAGNRSGRQRMRADLTQVPARPPRGMILSTGEDLPKGHSLNARLLHLPLGPKELNFGALTSCQIDAARGLYAQALAGYLRWLAPQYEQIQATLKNEIVSLRPEGIGTHRRAPTIAANLGVGLKYWTQYLLESGVFTQLESERYWTDGWNAIVEAITQQGEHQDAQEPTQQFISLVKTALATGRAYVQDTASNWPLSNPERWGWKSGTDDSTQDYMPRGEHIGWIKGDSLYLEPTVLFTIVQRVGRESGSSTLPNKVTIERRLYENGLLVRTDIETERNTYTTRKVLPVGRIDVLWFRTQTFFDDESPQDMLEENPTNPTLTFEEDDSVGLVGSDDNKTSDDVDGNLPPGGSP